MNEYKKALEILKKGFPLHFTMSDEDVSKTLTTQIATRDVYYTDLLKNHLTLTTIRGYTKEIHKWLFFWLVVIAGALSVFYIIRVFNRVLASEDVKVMIEAIPIIIASLVSLVSTVIAVPTTISKFLFNTKEDDNITNLIQHTQDHDSAGMDFFKERFSNAKIPNTKTQYYLDDDES